MNKSFILFLFLIFSTGYSQKHGTRINIGKSRVPQERPVTIPHPYEDCIGCRPLAQMISTSGVKAYWGFQSGTGNDSSGNGNHLNMGAALGAGSNWYYSWPVDFLTGPTGMPGPYARGGDTGLEMWVESNPSFIFEDSSWTVGLNVAKTGIVQTRPLLGKWRWSTGLEWLIDMDGSGHYRLSISTDSLYTSVVRYASDSLNSVPTNDCSMDQIIAWHDKDADSVGISVNGGPSKKWYVSNLRISPTISKIGVACNDGVISGYASSVDEVFIVNGRRWSDTEIRNKWNDGYGLTYPFIEWPVDKMNPRKYASKIFSTADSIPSTTDSTFHKGNDNHPQEDFYASYDAFGLGVQCADGVKIFTRRGRQHVDTAGQMIQLFLPTGSSDWQYSVWEDSIKADDRNGSGGVNLRTGYGSIFWDIFIASSSTSITYYKSTTDGGITWGSKKALVNHVPSIAPYGKLYYHKGNYFQSLYSYSDGCGELYLYRSTDNCDTWHFFSRIDSSSLRKPVESVVEVLHGDTLISVSRLLGIGLGQHSSVDGGVTWRWDGKIMPYQVQLLHGEQVSPWIYRDNDTVKLVMFMRNGDLGRVGHIFLTSAHVSQIVGLNWMWSYGRDMVDVSIANGDAINVLRSPYYAWHSTRGGQGGNEGYPSVVFGLDGVFRYTWSNAGPFHSGKCIDAPDVYVTK